MPDARNSPEELYAEYTALRAASERIEKSLLREKNLRDKFGFDNTKKINNLLKKLSRLNATKCELKSLAGTNA
jgi:hypothetical protein